MTTSWPLRLAVFLFLATTAVIVCYYLIFPGLLRKARPSWPIDAYGTATACAWLAVGFLAFGIFRDLLNLEVLNVATGSEPVDYYLPKALVLIVTVLGSVLWWRLCRSKARPELGGAPKGSAARA